MGNALPVWQSAGWYRATTLSERATSLHTGVYKPLSDGSGNMEKAQRRLQRWKAQKPFDQETFFAERLAQEGLNERDLLALLAEPAEALRARFADVPHWLNELHQAFANVNTSHNLPTPSLSLQLLADTTDILPIIQPLLLPGIQKLEKGIQALMKEFSYLPFDPQSIRPVLLGNLALQVVPRMRRTFALELNVARLQGRLTGETSEERFQSYVQLLCQPENMLVLLAEYCVLARQLVIDIDNWLVYSLEFLRHLCTDWQAIRTLFTPENDPGKLIDARAGAGDTHRRGRSVLVLEFASGFQLVYKPKSLAVDVHFQQVLTWLNEQGQQPALRPLTLLDRGSYGWSEFVAFSSCQSEEELARFYQRQGAYLALLYALDAVDFHFENVIAAGEQPLLIDLEALFHPRAHDIPPEQPALKALDNSVLSIGLLPVRIWSNGNVDGVDVSGLGGQEGQLMPIPIPRWTGAGTDQMRLVQEPVTLEAQQNRPRLNGQEVQTLDYRDHIIQGFTQMYRLLIANRDTFLTDLLPRFAHDEVRFLVRHTKAYAMLLHESLHPNMLRDALQRERWFDRLWISAPTQPYLSKLIDAERTDLLEGDIPMFTARPGSRDLYTSRNVCIPEFFSTPSLSTVTIRISQLNEEDLSWQTWIIRAAFTSMATDAEPAIKTSRLLQPSDMPVTRERLLAGAEAVGERLGQLAISNADAVSWLGIMQARGSTHSWNLMPADISLYDGNSGIALFLAYLGHITGKEHYTALARKALTAIRSEISAINKLPRYKDIGAFIGLGSPLYLFSHLGTLWDEPALLQEALDIVALLPDRIKQDDRLDLASGSAGCIASLLSLYAVVPSPLLLTTAIQCGDHLLAQALPMKVGRGWRTRAYAPYPPTPGFAHGTAGIAWSLLALTDVSRQERFRQGALEAFAYERSLFSPEEQTWFMPSADESAEKRQRVKVSWNQGAPGIALSRMASLKHIDEPYIDKPLLRDEIEIALERTIIEGFDGNAEGVHANHSLSHGYFGNLETLLTATQVIGEPLYREHLDRFTAILLDSIDAHGWITASPLNVETPGLMVGLAGIGYELLRLAEPERVPSVLSLAPPTLAQITHDLDNYFAKCPV